MSPAEAKTAAKRAAIGKAHGKTSRAPSKAQADLAETAIANKLGKSSGAKAKQTSSLMQLIAEEAAMGLRDIDRLVIKKGQAKPTVEFQVSPGQYSANRPKSPGFAAQASSKLDKLEKTMCKAASTDMKKVCEGIAKAKNSVVDLLVGKAQQAVEGIKQLFHIGFVEEEAAITRTETNAETPAEYKIYGDGAHHEFIVCNALKGADLTRGPANVVTWLRGHFNAATDCDDAIGKFSSTYPQWWPTIGARWNDVPCEGTDAAAFRDSFVDTCYDYFMNPTMQRGHHGDRAYWHSMTNAVVRRSHATQGDVVNAIIAQAQAWLAQGVAVSGGNVNLKSLLWNLGRTGHMIGDSYACGHTVRETTGRMKILFFQDYEGQSSSKHGRFDKDARVGTSAGTVRAIDVTKSIVKIFFHELGRVMGFPYTAATSAGGANGQTELANFLRTEVYPFYSNEHRAYTALGCEIKNTVDGSSDCVRNLSPSTPDPPQICPDFPRTPASEFV